jgi:hypothetical protein
MSAHFDIGGLDFTALTALAAEKGLHLCNLDEQPHGDDDEPHYVVVMLGDYVPPADGNRDDMPEKEGYEHREVWVSTLPVVDCRPMYTVFAELDTDHQGWHELADLAESETLELSE